MGFFNIKKKKDFIDLTEKYRKDLEKQKDLKENVFNNSQESESSNQYSDSSNAFSFLGNLANFGKANNSSQEDYSYEDSEKIKKFTQRIKNMTNQIEDLSNQIYRLQQRIELLERKLDINRF